MTDLIPTPEWSGVRQIETTDKVLGGPLPEGVANLHAQALSNQNLYARKHGGTLPFLPGLTYDTGDRVKLASGAIVVSEDDGNVTDPNVNMTGWSFDDDNVGSVDALRSLDPKSKGRKVCLLSYRQGSWMGGGDFVATQKAGLVDNSVTVFASPDPSLFWVRTNYDVLTPEMAGAYADNVQDDTFAFDRIKAVINSVQLGEKTYLVNIVFTNFFNLKGISSKNSVLKAFDKTKPVIKNMNKYPSWEYSSVESLQLHGSGTKEGIGFCYGDEEAYSVNASYIGRVKFKDVYTSNFDKHIAKFWGNIGNIYDNVSMDTGNYGYYSRGAQIKDPQAAMMHAGCDLLLGGHVAKMDKMGMLILDKTGGAGQWTLINTIFEVNAGGAIYLDLEIPYSTLWCPIILQNVWFELNATLPTVTIDNKDGGTSTIVPNGRFTQNGGVYPAFIELGSQSKFGTNSAKGTVNIWGNEDNDALSVFGGRIGSYDYSQIGFYSDSDPALTRGASIRSDRFPSSFGRTLSMYSGDGLFLYGGPNRNVVIGHPGTQGTFLGSSNVLTLAGSEDVPEGGITHRFKAGYGAVTHIYQTGSEGSNTAATAIRIPTNTTTGRSINAGGTVNASGADYAEYMYKSDGCLGIEKGEVVGVDVDGKLTKVYDDAISFVIKSTNPSIVGGDIWFNESFDENEPTNTFNEVLSEGASAEEIDQFNARIFAYNEKLEVDILEYKERLKSFNDRLEVGRQKVDRIAFCGQVPIAYEANSGDYIIPLRNTDGSIGIETTKQPTFEQHLKCVGKVWKVVESIPYVVVFNN